MRSARKQRFAWVPRNRTRGTNSTLKTQIALRNSEKRSFRIEGTRVGSAVKHAHTRDLILVPEGRAGWDRERFNLEGPRRGSRRRESDPSKTRRRQKHARGVC